MGLSDRVFLAFMKLWIGSLAPQKTKQNKKTLQAKQK
jgi:hypothetical protein